MNILISLNKDKTAIISEEDYEIVKRYKWYGI